MTGRELSEKMIYIGMERNIRRLALEKSWLQQKKLL